MYVSSLIRCQKENHWCGMHSIYKKHNNKLRKVLQKLCIPCFPHLICIRLIFVSVLKRLTGFPENCHVLELCSSDGNIIVITILNTYECKNYLLSSKKKISRFWYKKNKNKTKYKQNTMLNVFSWSASPAALCLIRYGAQEIAQVWFYICF